MSELDPNASPSLTRKQAIRIASRLLAAYLLLWALDDITMVPREILSVAQTIHFASKVGIVSSDAIDASYSIRSSILYLLENVLRITIWLLGALWFYRCGPRIQRFFTDEELG